MCRASLLASLLGRCGRATLGAVRSLRGTIGAWLCHLTVLGGSRGRGRVGAVVAQVLGRLTDGQDLARGQAAWAMEQIMTGNATPAQIAAFAVAMKMKAPTAAEVGELADVMLSHARRLPTEQIGDRHRRHRRHRR